MTNCKRFNKCSAPLCPLDENLDERYWYSDESVCASQEHGDRRWIKKQKQIVERKTKRWLNKPVSHQQLFNVSRPRKLSEAQKKQLIEMGLDHRFKKGD